MTDPTTTPDRLPDMKVMKGNGCGLILYPELLDAVETLPVGNYTLRTFIVGGDGLTSVEWELNEVRELLREVANSWHGRVREGEAPDGWVLMPETLTIKIEQHLARKESDAPGSWVAAAVRRVKEISDD